MKTKINQPEAKKQSTTPFFANANSSGFLGVQTKLTTGKPDDQYETEADSIADKIVNRTQSGLNDSYFRPVQHQSNNPVQEKPLAETISPFVQKKEINEEDDLKQKGDSMEQTEEELQIENWDGQSEKEEEEPIQMKDNEEDDLTHADGETTANPDIESKLNNSSGGQKMDANIQAEMENGFGADLSRVNIHTDAAAVQMSRQLGAQAFTHGNDIYFNEGKYKPDSTNSKHLLAHELTHTIQQSGMIPNNLQFRIGDNRDLLSDRFSGNRVLEACMDNERTLQQGSRGTAVTLVQQALIDAGFPLPENGANGIFNAETKTALEDFQRASSLVVDGKLGQNTISALDALFSGGVPELAPAIPATPAPTTAPTVTSQTILSAPDATADTRTTVGVGERVRFTSTTAGTWTVTDGRIIGLNTGVNMVWEAPAVAANPTITITTPGGNQAIPFTVIVPDDLTMAVGAHDNIPVGRAGACMITNVTINPLNVSFGRTQWLEVPGPATNVTGYFNRFSAAALRHHPNPRYLPFNDNNTGLSDHAALHRAPTPYSLGTFEWVIPNRYKIDGEPDAQGRFFTDTVQAFSIMADGTVIIDKAGDFVSRTTSNVII
jgi:peptidoglycan hydrolase-like protein with peptidoglycan-binding domain